MKATPEGGSFLSEIGRLARSKGLDVDLYAYNLYLTDPKDAVSTEKEFLKKLEKQLRDSRRDKYYDLMLGSIIRGIKEEVKYIIKKPSFEIVKTYLNKNIPVSARLNYAALINMQEDPFDNYDVVLGGLKNGQVYLIDPKAIFQSKVISASAYLLAVKPK